MTETLTATYEETLLDLARNDGRIIVMTAENRAAIRTLPDLLGDRFIDMGIAEQTMVGAAAGLALRGRIPVVHALATFLTLRAFEFIRDDIGIPQLPVKLMGAVPGFLSDGNGPTHQAIDDIGVMRMIPGMRIFCPADKHELLEGLPAVLSDGNPWYVRFNATDSGLHHGEPVVPGKAETFGHGNDVAILTYGLLTREAHTAMQRLIAKGLSVRLVNLRTLAPVDEDALFSAVMDAELVVTVEDHFHNGGLAAILSELMIRRRVMTQVLNLSLGSRWFHPALLREAMAHAGLDANGITNAILEHV